MNGTPYTGTGTALHPSPTQLTSTGRYQVVVLSGPQHQVHALVLIHCCQVLLVHLDHALTVTQVQVDVQRLGSGGEGESVGEVWTVECQYDGQQEQAAAVGYNIVTKCGKSVQVIYAGRQA